MSTLGILLLWERPGETWSVVQTNKLHSQSQVLISFQTQSWFFLFPPYFQPQWAQFSTLILFIAACTNGSVLFQAGVLLNKENAIFLAISAILSWVYALFGVPFTGLNSVVALQNWQISGMARHTRTWLVFQFERFNNASKATSMSCTSFSSCAYIGTQR